MADRAPVPFAPAREGGSAEGCDEVAPQGDRSGEQSSRSARLWASLPVRILLASILTIAAYTKIKDPAEIIATVGRSGLVGSAWDKPVAYALIVAEIFLALLLLPRPTARLGAAGYAALSSVFFGYSLWRGWQDIKAPCGCFGLLLRLLPWQGALLSTLMCLAALLALRGLSTSRAFASTGA